MRYRVNNVEIRSENAAKPSNIPGRDVMEWIDSLPRWARVLDYGCGKFRYTIPLSKRVRHVHAVDSVVQVERTQIINGIKGSLKTYALKYLPNVAVGSVENEEWKENTYDFALCANVLSAIPDVGVRLTVLRRLHSTLRPGGTAFIVTQFSSTYFKIYESNPNSERFLDGWLIRGSRGASFYGIIPPERVESMCRDAGFSTVQWRVNGKRENAMVVATKSE